MHEYILIVDDDAGLAELIVEWLEERGYRTRTVRNGRAALDSIRAETPDLVVTDLMMPEISGMAMARALRSHPRYAVLPVVLMTSMSPRVVSESRILFDAVLDKPFTPEDLFATIEPLLQARSRRTGRAA